MENVNKGSNTLIKTIMFLIVVALSCLLFFGLGNTDKSGIQLVSFGFIIFAELVVYVSTLLAGIIKSEKITSADIISCGILYAIASLLINMVFSITEMRPLIVFNIAAILAYLLLFTIVIGMKKK